MSDLLDKPWRKMEEKEPWSDKVVHIFSKLYPNEKILFKENCVLHCMAPFGPFCLVLACFAPLCPVMPCLAPFGPFGPFGPVWPRLSEFGPVWPLLHSLTPFDPV